MLPPLWRSISMIGGEAESGQSLDFGPMSRVTTRHAFLCGIALTSPLLRIMTIARYRRICRSTAGVGQQSTLRPFAFW